MGKLAKLQELASKATVGPWSFVGLCAEDTPHGVGSVIQWIVCSDHGAVCRIRNTVSGKPLTKEDSYNAEFIAAMNPELVQRLLSWVTEAKSLLSSEADRVLHEYPESAETSGVRACCGAASFLPHRPKCKLENLLRAFSTFDDEGLSKGAGDERN